MNEDAIKDAYDLFVNTGYNKSYDNFKALIQSNPNARKDAYDLFVSTGYNKTQKDFDQLMGIGAPAPVKKKEQVSPSQQKAQPTSLATGGEMAGGPSEPSARKRYDVKGRAPQSQPVKPTAQLTQRDYELMMPFMGTPDDIATVVGDAPIEQPNPFAEDVKRAGNILTKKTPEGDAFTAGIIKEKPPTKTYAKEVLAAVEAPKENSYIEKVVNSTTAAGLLANKIAASETMSDLDDVDFEEIAGFNKQLQDNAIEEEEGVVGFIKYLPTVVMQSAGSMIIAAPSGLAAGAVGAGVGSVVPGLGTAAGAAAGFASGTSLALEYSSSLMGSLRDAGVDITDADQLKAAFNSPEKMSEAKSYALKRGIPVAIFDAISGGIAGKFFKTAAGATTKQLIKAGAKETGVQAVLGGAGEATAQLIADGKLDGRQIAYEMVAEPVTSLPPAAINYLGDKAKTAAEKKYVQRIDKDVDLKIKSDVAVVTDPEIADASKKINEYRKLKEEAVSQTAKDEYDKRISQERERKYTAYENFFSKFDNLPEERKQEAYGLLDEIGQTKDEYNAATSSQEKKILGEVLSQKIKTLKTYAVQEQTTSEVPVQPEARVGQEVVEGKPQPEPQVAAEEGQAQEEVIPGEKAVVSGIEITYPTEQEKVERQEVRNSEEYVSAKASELPVVTEEEFQGDIEGEFAMVTAENPMAQPLTEEENVSLNAKAEQWLIDKGYSPKKIVGKYDQAENSFFVKGMTKDDALAFAKEFNQDSVAHSDGLIYQSGKMNPRDKAQDNFEAKKFVAGDNFVSVINTPEGPKTFSVGYDFNTETDFTPKGNFEEAINKSAQSLNMVAPGLKIIIAENTDDAQMQIAEALSAVAPSQASDVAAGFTTETRGQTVFVNGKPYAMVFNKETADSVTAGHEVWEALLNDAFADDQARMKEFVDSIDAQLRAQGFEDIADRLEAFASQRGYEAVKYSEYMAELGGMLVASGFGKGPLTAQQKTLLQKIGDIINKFAELFTGKKQFLDQATPEDILGFMITISEKVSKGQDVASFFRPKEVTPSKTDKKGNLTPPTIDSRNQLQENTSDIEKRVKASVSPGNIVSTRIPAKGDPHSKSNLVINTESIMKEAKENKNAEKFAITIARKVADYPIVNVSPESINTLEDANKVFEKLKEGVKGNLKWLYDQFSDEVRTITKLWYDGANKISNEISKEYGYTLDQVAGVMAVLSPQMDWFRNLSLGRRVIEIYNTKQEYSLDDKMANYMLNAKSEGKMLFNEKLTKKEIGLLVEEMKGKKFKELSLPEKAFFVRAYDEVYNTRDYENISPTGEVNGFVRNADGSRGKVGWGGFGPIIKSISILEDGKIKNISENLGEQHKVRNFFNNISSPNDKNAVTIDTHAVAAALLEPLAGSDEQVALNLGGPKTNSIGSVGTYAIYADAYRELASELGILPRELQSITWEAVRGLYKAKFKQSKKNKQAIKDIWEQFRNKEKNIKEVYEAINEKAGGVSKPVWYEYVAEGDGKTYEENSAAVDQAKLSEDYQLEQPGGRTESIEVTAKSQKAFEDVAKQYPNSELAKQEGSEIGLSEITVDGDVVYIQAIEYPNMATAKPVIAWNSKGENIAFANFRQNKDGDWYSMQSETNKSLQRKGIMNAIYDLAEKSIGKIVQSKEQSVEAKAFWDKRKSKSKKTVPLVVDEVLTDDGKGNYVFVHYSDEKRDTIKPMSGSKKNFTGREEVAAISSVGGVAMYYTKQGQKEQGVGNVPHTVLVPKDKVYFYGTTERGKVSNDPENFEPEARRRFQEYKNRGNETRPTTYAFDSNNAAAWVTKVAAENGYDMVVTNWGAPKSYRAQTVKELTPEAEYTGFKQLPDDVFEVGDEVFVYGNYGNIVKVDGKVLTISQENQFGTFNERKFEVTPFTADRILLVEKAKPTVTTRAQKVDVTVIPGYERMMGEVEGIIEKTLNRGGSYNQASAAAIGYIQKSAVYERADDSQREQIIRDFKKIRGEKMKAAPSVARIMGQIKDTKEVTVKEKTALKDQIKLEAKAAKDAVAYVKQLRTQISTALRAMTGRGVISARQATTILARYDKMNILNPVMRDRFVDYMSNVLQTAEYLDKIREASKLRRAIKKASKSADNQAEVSKMAKDFAGIDPSRVEDIDQYIENATQVLNSAARKTGDPLMRNPVNMANMANYIEQEMEIQNEQIKNEILSKYQELVDAGVLSSDMTINEIKRVVAAIEENDSDAQAKVAKAKEALKGMMEEISPVIMQMVRTGEDPFTGEPIELTYDEKKALKSLTEMDLDNLSLADAVKVVEYANNFVANGITSGIVGITELYNGSLEPGKLVKKGFKSIPIRKYFMKGAGKVWAEGFATLPMLNKLFWGDTRRAMAVSEASGVTGISNGKAKALRIVDKAAKEYIAKFAKAKDFLASENVLERGMVAFMSRGVVGDEFQVQDEYNRRKTLIEETIQALKDPENSTDLEIAKGEVAQKVYDKILKDSKNAEDVRSKASKTNVDAVDWWINEWSKYYDQMDEVSRNVYNTELSRDINYTPDRFQMKEAPTATEEDFESSFFGNFEYVDTSKSGSLKKNNRIKNLPEDKNGVKKRIVNLDFDINNVNALTNALVDVETAGSVMKVKGFVTSKDFSKLFSSKEDRDLYKKRIVKYVSRVKGGSYVDQNELAKMNKVINAIASFGVAKALFSLSQPLKQFVPPMLNTLTQTGRFDIAELFKGGMEFIDNSGYPIANRGIGSQGELKSINRKLVEAEKNLALRGLDGVAEFSNAALELTLKNPDIYAARASWISFYLSELKKQGVKPSNIDWRTHKLNKQAADYAQSMVDSQQNISDTDMQGEIFASKQPATVFLRRALLPLMTFTLNQKTRIWADIRTIGNEVSSKEDKLEAKKSLAGALVELTAFSAIAFGVKELLYMTAQAIFGVEEDDEEEEKKKRMMRQSASTAQNFLRDFFLPPIPGMDAVASGGVNILLDKSGLSETIPQKWFDIEDEEARFNLYDKQNQGYLDMLGTQGIAAEKALELAGYYDMAIDGKFTKEYNGNKVEKQVLEEDRKAAALNALVMSGYYGGLLPSDIAYIAGIINKKIQKRAEDAEEED
jgi:hypothetical protein